MSRFIDIEDVVDWFPHDYDCSPYFSYAEWYSDQFIAPSDYYLTEEFALKLEAELRSYHKEKIAAKKRKQKDEELRRISRHNEAVLLWKWRNRLGIFFAGIWTIRRRIAIHRKCIQMKPAFEIPGTSSKPVLFHGEILERLRARLSICKTKDDKIEPTWYCWKDKWIVRIYWSAMMPRHSRIVVFTKMTSDMIQKLSYGWHVSFRRTHTIRESEEVIHTDSPFHYPVPNHFV